MHIGNFEWSEEIVLADAVEAAVEPGQLGEEDLDGLACMGDDDRLSREGGARLVRAQRMSAISGG